MSEKASTKRMFMKDSERAENNRQSMSLLDQTLNEEANSSKRDIVDDTILNLLNERPNISAWTKQDVQEWIVKSNLECLNEVKVPFNKNGINGAMLLALTESDLKKECFSVESLGKRKNIIRAIAKLKTSTCKLMNAGASLILTSPRASLKLEALGPNDFSMNHSLDSTLRQNQNIGSSDKSAILKSAHCFFSKKAILASDQEENKLKLIDNYQSSRFSSRASLPLSCRRSRTVMSGNLIRPSLDRPISFENNHAGYGQYQHARISI